MAYIANRPVRFDRNYAVGEIIPEEVIEPKMIRKLQDMGRILHVNLPDGTGNAEETHDDTSANGAEDAQEGAGAAESTEGEDTQADAVTAQNEPQEGADGAEDAQGKREFVCQVCGKAFSTQNGLSAHARIHKE